MDVLEVGDHHLDVDGTVRNADFAEDLGDTPKNVATEGRFQILENWRKRFTSAHEALVERVGDAFHEINRLDFEGVSAHVGDLHNLVVKHQVEMGALCRGCSSMPSLHKELDLLHKLIERHVVLEEAFQANVGDLHYPPGDPRAGQKISRKGDAVVFIGAEGKKRRITQTP